MVNLDGILLLSRTPEEYIRHIREGPTLLKQRRCHSQTQEMSVLYQNHRLFRTHITPKTSQNHFLHNQCNTRTPRIDHHYGTQILLMICNVFRRFVPSFTQLATSLNNKLRKDQQLTFQLAGRGHAFHQVLMSISLRKVFHWKELPGLWTPLLQKCHLWCDR